MPTRRGGSLAAAGTHSARRQKNPSVHLGPHRPRRKPLRAAEVRKRLENLALALVLAALAPRSPKFPRRTLRAALRNLLKAAASTGTLTSSRSTSTRGPSRRQLSRVTENLDQGRLQRKITWTLRAQVGPWIPSTPVDVAIDFHLIPYAGDQPLPRLLDGGHRSGRSAAHLRTPGGPIARPPPFGGPTPPEGRPATGPEGALAPPRPGVLLRRGHRVPAGVGTPRRDARAGRAEDARPVGEGTALVRPPSHHAIEGGRGELSGPGGEALQEGSTGGARGGEPLLRRDRTPSSARETAGVVPRPLWDRSHVPDRRVGQGPDHESAAGLPPAADGARHPRGERVDHPPAHARDGAVSRTEGVPASGGTAALRASPHAAADRPTHGGGRDPRGERGGSTAEVHRTVAPSGAVTVTGGRDQLLSLGRLPTRGLTPFETAVPCPLGIAQVLW